jgi:Domain of unknown function (DUF5753)/Helix-turn-helix domain
VAMSKPRQGNSTSTVLGRRLGGELMRLRTEAGLTQGHAARTLTASTTKVAKMEGGWVPIRDPDIRALCELYEVRDPTAVGALLELARVDRERRKAKGWWDESALGSMHEYVTLESVATTVRTWQPAFIPGLLQTPDYVRAIRLDHRNGQLDDGDESFVRSRIRRQSRLTEGSPLALHTLVYEAALRSLIGGADTMRGQLEHLVRVTQRPNISVRVVPFGSGAHVGLNSPVTLLSFAEPGAMDVVYLEVPFTQLWVEGGKDALRHNELFETLARRALGESESITFIKTLAEDL